MVRLATKRQNSEEWERDDVYPNIVKRIQKLCHESRTCIAYMSSKRKYEIVDDKSVLPVSLNNHTCICGVWQRSGIPCKHSMRAIIHARLDPHHFVHEWYSVRRYKQAYSFGIMSIPDVEQWPDINMPNIQLPTIKRSIRRPCRNRKRADDGERKGKRSKTVQCSKCKSFGYNAKTCKGGVTAKQAAARPGHGLRPGPQDGPSCLCTVAGWTRHEVTDHVPCPKIQNWCRGPCVPGGPCSCLGSCSCLLFFFPR